MSFRMFACLLGAFAIVVCSNSNSARVHAEGSESWQRFNSVEEAGFDSGQLAKVDSMVRSSNAACVIIVRSGKIVRSWGDSRRCFRMASIRKSFLNAVFGKAVAIGQIDTSATLKEINLTDIGGLSENEQKARIADLLCARSGVYHASAYSPQGMLNSIPERDSYAPGSHWFYNNWDFNALATIYEEFTHVSLFNAFKAQIADPIGMEDFSLDRTYYRYDSSISIHPAYLFRLSGRDLARFGVLYCNEGRWNDEQVLPEDWVRATFESVSPDLDHFSHQSSYGRLWWIVDSVAGSKMYFAAGSGGQRLFIFPELEMVVVNLMDTYGRASTNDVQLYRLCQAIVKSCTKAALPQTGFSPWDPKSYTPEYQPLNRASLDMTEIVRAYMHPAIGEVRISDDDDRLVAHTGLGQFGIRTVNDNELVIEDIRAKVHFERAESAEKEGMIRMSMTSKGSLSDLYFYY